MNQHRVEITFLSGRHTWPTVTPTHPSRRLPIWEEQLVCFPLASAQGGKERVCADAARASAAAGRPTCGCAQPWQCLVLRMGNWYPQIPPKRNVYVIDGTKKKIPHTRTPLSLVFPVRAVSISLSIDGQQHRCSYHWKTVRTVVTCHNAWPVSISGGCGCSTEGKWSVSERQGTKLIAAGKQCFRCWSCRTHGGV